MPTGFGYGDSLYQMLQRIPDKFEREIERAKALRLKSPLTFHERKARRVKERQSCTTTR